MTALNANRDTPRHSVDVDPALISMPVAATTHIYSGSLVCDNGSGYATPGAVSTALLAVGRAEEEVDNNPGSAGDKNVTVRRGCFKYGNSSSSDEITIADRFSTCYIVDDQTVAKTDGSGTRSRAGIVIDVASDGVWVLIGSEVVLNITDVENKALHRLSLNITDADLTDTDTSQAFDFASALPTNALIQGITLVVTEAFSDGSTGTFTATLGDGTTADQYASALDIDATAGTVAGSAVWQPASGVTPTLTVTGSVNLNTASAGDATVHIWYAILATS